MRKLNKWNHIPLVVSHAGVTGTSIETAPIKKIKPAKSSTDCDEVFWYKKEGLCGTSFNPWTINLFDEDILEVLGSSGLIGLSLDQRILGFGKTIGEFMSPPEVKELELNSKLSHKTPRGYGIPEDFLNELAVSYESYLEQRPAPLPELTVQYADFAVWQRNWLRGEVFERLLSYWQQQLKGAPARLELPTDKPRPEVQSYRGAKQFASLSAQLTQSLKELSSQEDATLYMTLLACYNTLLHYYTGANDIVVGTDVANRNRGETESLIGFFVNELVMRSDLSGNPTFRELIGRVREVAIGAYNHQDMPFDRLVDALKIERSPAHHPLFQVCFVLQNTPAAAVQVKSLTISTLPVENPIALFDLVLRAGESAQGMQLMLEYNADLFMPATITRLLDLLETLAGIVVQQPEARLETLVEMLAQADRARLADKGKAFEEIGSKSLKKAKRRTVATQ